MMQHYCVGPSGRCALVVRHTRLPIRQFAPRALSVPEEFVIHCMCNLFKQGSRVIALSCPTNAEAGGVGCGEGSRSSRDPRSHGKESGAGCCTGPPCAPAPFRLVLPGEIGCMFKRALYRKGLLSSSNSFQRFCVWI